MKLQVLSRSKQLLYYKPLNGTLANIVEADENVDFQTILSGYTLFPSIKELPMAEYTIFRKFYHVTPIYDQ